MKKIKIMLIVFILMLINCENVLAECSSEEVQVLKEKASNIEIKLNLRENVEGEFGTLNKVYDVIVNNLTEEFFLIDGYYGESYGVRDNDENGQIVFKSYMPGIHNFKIYSQECGILISTIKVEVPRYNPFFGDPLCEGISGEDLDVCGEWYSGELDYETFKAKVEKYKNSNNLEDNKNSNSSSSINKIVIFLVVLVLVMATLVSIVTIKRKRRVLQ